MKNTVILSAMMLAPSALIGTAPNSGSPCRRRGLLAGLHSGEPEPADRELPGDL